MGMFDSFFDAKGNDWQTKAFGRTLEQWEVGSEIPGAHPLPFQVEVLGGEINAPGDFVESFVTIRDRRVVAVPAERDESLPLLQMGGGWASAPALVAEVERLRGIITEATERLHLPYPGQTPESEGNRARDWWFQAHMARSVLTRESSDSSSTGGEL